LMRRSLLVSTCVLALAQTSGAAERIGLGRPISQAGVAPWDIDVRTDGAGLPPGSGSVAQGKQVYGSQCAVCHGDNGEGRTVAGAAGGCYPPVRGGGTTTTPCRSLAV